MHHLIWRVSLSCRIILWSRYWFARYWSGSWCKCCVGFDWKVRGKSWINRYIWQSALPLLDELTELWIGALGTLWQNRFHGAPGANKTTLAKKPRGSYDFATSDKNLVVLWLDNKVLTCVTNYVTCNLDSTAQRCSKSAKKRVDVPMQKPFKSCNRQMSGVDLFDQFVSTYWVRIRSKKWWWSFFAWAANVSMANAWNLFRTLQKQNIGMLEFQREVVMTVLAYSEKISQKRHWCFQEMLQPMWSLIPKITSLWKAHQNIVTVNTVMIDHSIYARNAMLSYTLTVSRSIIHETQILLYYFLPEVLIM